MLLWVYHLNILQSGWSLCIVLCSTWALPECPLSQGTEEQQWRPVLPNTAGGVPGVLPYGRLFIPAGCFSVRLQCHLQQTAFCWAVICWAHPFPAGGAAPVAPCIRVVQSTARPGSEGHDSAGRTLLTCLCIAMCITLWPSLVMIVTSGRLLIPAEDRQANQPLAWPSVLLILYFP